MILTFYTTLSKGKIYSTCKTNRTTQDLNQTTFVITEGIMTHSIHNVCL